MAISEYQCLSCMQKHAVEKDFSGKIKRLNVDEDFDNPNDPSTMYRCSFCGNELVPHTIKQANRITENQAVKALKAVAVTKANLSKEPENAEMLTSLGLLYITCGNYQDAVKTLEKAQELDPINASIYFYIAIAMLKGKIPRLSSKPDIVTIAEKISTAIEFEEDPVKQGLYKCLYAYVQYDFFESRCMLAKPSSSSLIAEAQQLDVDAEELDDLFALLKVSKPAILK